MKKLGGGLVDIQGAILFLGDIAAIGKPEKDVCRVIMRGAPDILKFAADEQPALREAWLTHRLKQDPDGWQIAHGRYKDKVEMPPDIGSPVGTEALGIWKPWTIANDEDFVWRRPLRKVKR